MAGHQRKNLKHGNGKRYSEDTHDSPNAELPPFRTLRFALSGRVIIKTSHEHSGSKQVNEEREPYSDKSTSDRDVSKESEGQWNVWVVSIYVNLGPSEKMKAMVAITPASRTIRRFRSQIMVETTATINGIPWYVGAELKYRNNWSKSTWSNLERARARGRRQMPE